MHVGALVLAIMLLAEVPPALTWVAEAVGAPSHDLAIRLAVWNFAWFVNHRLFIDFFCDLFIGAGTCHRVEVPYVDAVTVHGSVGVEQGVPRWVIWGHLIRNEGYVAWLVVIINSCVVTLRVVKRLCVENFWASRVPSLTLAQIPAFEKVWILRASGNFDGGGRVGAAWASD